MPPPLAPELSPARAMGFPPLFQTLSAGGGPNPLSVVPPTEVTYGWLLGSSTASAGLGGVSAKQSSEPLSPAAAKMLCPSVAACWNRLLSALAEAWPLSDSQAPQEVEITCARFWLMIEANVS